MVVTDQGVAVNPRRPEVAEKLRKAGVRVYTIEQLRDKALALVGRPDPIRYLDRIVGVVMYRDNTVIDVIGRSRSSLPPKPREGASRRFP